MQGQIPAGAAPFQMNIKPEDLRDYECETEGCDSQTFSIGLKFKSISALLSPIGKESLIPIDIFICTKCGAEVIKPMLMAAGQ